MVFIPLYIRYSLLTLVGFGVADWLLGVTTEVASKGDSPIGKDRIALSNAALQLFSSGLAAIMVLLVRRKTNGDWFAKMKASSVWIAGAFGGVFFAVGMLWLVIALGQDPDSKGPISAILACNGAIIALIFYILFREKLKKSEVGGMMLAFGGLMLITFGNGIEADSIKGPIMGIVALLLFVGKNFVLKFLGKRKCDSLIVNSLLFVPSMFLGIGVVCFQYAKSGSDGILEGLDGHHGLLYAYPLIAGVSLWFGSFMMTKAFKNGPAGPIGALGNSMALLVLSLDVIIMGDYPSYAKIGGMLVMIVGVTVLSLARSGEKPKDIDLESILDLESSGSLETSLLPERMPVE
eukprot:TRINITY_DN780096_c0_g1_i1.p1 TRINITY_DN780096_c0_g1~~TRINITY_DN780096_c0_g1_i1.p1  ORF type:complete len:349 (+),score=95.09 TRINITY_DN780096_c0_g1_i1:107-1153(+)